MRSLILACILLMPSAFAQHDGRSMTMPDSGQKTGKDVSESLSYAINSVQEPEALEMRTGENLPAPELLHDVLLRPAMTLADWMDYAEMHQPSLIEARAAVARSEQQARQLALPPNPTIGYSGEHIRGGSYHGGEEGAFVSQQIVLGHKLALRRDAMKAEGRTNEFAVEVQRARVHNDVAQRFFDALQAQTVVTLRDRMMKQAADSEVNAHESMRVGQADAADVLKTEIASEEAKLLFVEAQRNYLAAFARLAATAGRPGMEAQPVTGALTESPGIDVAAILAKSDSSPAIQEAEAAVAATRAKLQSEKREAVPDITVTGGEWYSGERLDGTNKASGWMGFAQAGVQVPLWNRNQGSVGAAQADVTRAQADVVRTKMSLRARMEPLAQHYQQAQFTAERYRTQLLPRARRAYDLEVMKYQQMGQAYAKVLEAQGMVYSLQLGYVDALHDVWSDAVALENFALEGALNEPGSSPMEMQR